MVEGTWPQSWMHSYRCSPSPRVGFLRADLSWVCAAKRRGAARVAAAAVKNVRRVGMPAAYGGGPADGNLNTPSLWDQVERRRVELPTSSLRTMRSTN